MPKLKIVSAKKLLNWLKKRDFVQLRQSGSHIFLRKGSITTTLPIHTKDLPRGMIRKILRDTEISIETYSKEI